VLFTFVDSKRANISSSDFKIGSVNQTIKQQTVREGVIQSVINPYPTAFPYGNGMVLHLYQQ